MGQRSLLRLDGMGAYPAPQDSLSSGATAVHKNAGVSRLFRWRDKSAGFSLGGEYTSVAARGAGCQTLSARRIAGGPCIAPRDSQFNGT